MEIISNDGMYDIISQKINLNFIEELKKNYLKDNNIEELPSDLNKLYNKFSLIHYF